MRRYLFLCAVLIAVGTPSAGRAGLYYSGEPLAELPSQWRGFLLDQKTLRGLATPARPGVAENPLRQQYERKADELRTTAKGRELTADEAADLGAILVRLGESEAAVDVLRQAQRRHPEHFRVAANLGTAWQFRGDLAQSAQALQQAVRLAPEKHRTAERYHLKLVLGRLKAPASQLPDDLFGVDYAADGDAYAPGKLAAAEKKKLPADAVAVLQQLCLWLPADARLLWQLAEVANAHGDVRVAANVMDGCVQQFGLAAPLLRRHRQVLKESADNTPAPVVAGKEDHEQHVGGVVARSRRPLLAKLDAANLPPVRADGVNKLPWELLNETETGRAFGPQFADYVKQLNGKEVTLTGFMQPFNEELEHASFMFIEYPIGCWYCEMPALTGILLVETPRGQTAGYTRNLARVTGQLLLNYTDPEEFLYTIRNAKVAEID